MKKNLSNNILGGIWMLAAAFSFSLTHMLVKKTSIRLPAVEISFIRCVAQFIILSPFIFKEGLRLLASKRITLYFFRVALGTTNMIIFYYVLTKIPIANAISIAYSRPLFMVVVAFFMLGEKVGLHRILSTTIGFIGVLILIRPTTEGFNPAALWAVFAALCLTFTHIFIKKLSVTERPLAMLIWFSIISSLICLPFCIPVWINPNFYEVAFIFLVAALSILGQYATIKALFHGEASIVSALGYSEIVFTTLLGVLFLNEIPDNFTYIGAAIIVSSSLYILYRERKVKDET